MRTLRPASIAVEIRRVLRDGGSAEHAKGVQWFFKEEIKSHGWYTADLRKLAVSYRREILSHWAQQLDKNYCSIDIEFGQSALRTTSVWMAPSSRGFSISQLAVSGHRIRPKSLPHLE